MLARDLAPARFTSGIEFHGYRTSSAAPNSTGDFQPVDNFGVGAKEGTVWRGAQRCSGGAALRT